MPSPNPGTALNVLNAVRAVSASNIWAVGEFGNGTDSNHALILHWNGKKWSRMPSPSPGTGNYLAVSGATSAASAWAVGAAGTGSTRAAPILAWNGKRWSRSASHIQGPAVLNGVTRHLADS